MDNGDSARTLRLERERAVMVGALPKTDAAHPIVMAILEVVPASQWAFARLNAEGDLERLLDSGAPSRGLGELRSELTRQRVHAKQGPRIAAALGSMTEFDSGITLLFADARSTFGVLTLLRTKALGPFTSTEISMLTLALTSTSDHLSYLRLHPLAEAASEHQHSLDEKHGSIAEDAGESLYVLDRDFQIVLTWSPDERRRIAITGLQTRIADRLPEVLEATVRDLTSSWGTATDQRLAGIARPVPFLVVRTDPVSGPRGMFIGVRINRFQPANSLTEATDRFRISPREVQVLALLLDGEHIDEIGARLHITSSTVQDHIRSMVEKTGSRNRSDLIARVLGWEIPTDRS